MNDFIEEEKQGEPIGEIIRREFLPYWPIILFAGLIGLGVAYLKLRYTKPFYNSTAAIIFKSNENETKQVLSQLMGGQDAPGDRTKQNLEILRSREVALEAAKLLKANVQLHSKGRFIEQLLYKRDIKFKCTFSNQDSMIPFSGRITYDTKSKKYLVGDNFLMINGSSNVGGNVVTFAVSPEDEIKLRSGIYDLIIQTDEQLSSLFGNLQIAEVKGRPLLELTMQSEDPTLSSDLLSALLKAYNESYVRNNRLEVVNTISFIEDRMQVLEVQLDSVESTIEQFRKENPMVALSGGGSSILSDLKNSDKEQLQIDLQLNMLSDLEKYIQGRGQKPGLVPSFVGVAYGEEIKEYLGKLYESEEELDKLKLTTSTSSEGYQQAERKLRTLRTTITELIENIRRNILVLKEASKKEVDKFNEQLSAMPSQRKATF